MSATPSASLARRRILHPIGTLAVVKDLQAEAALAEVKKEMAEEASAKKKASRSNAAARAVITPPSSIERAKLQRKVKKNQSLAEVDPESDDGDEEEFVARDRLSLFGRTGGKRRLNFEDVPSANDGSPSKRTRMERLGHTKTPALLPAEWDMTPWEKASLSDINYANRADVNGMRPSQHPATMKDKLEMNTVPGSGVADEHAHSQPVQYSSTYTQHSPKTLIPKAISRNGKPRKSGDELVAEIQEKVRIKLHQRYGWSYSGAPAKVSSRAQAVSRTMLTVRRPMPLPKSLIISLVKALSVTLLTMKCEPYTTVWIWTRTSKTSWFPP